MNSMTIRAALSRPPEFPFRPSLPIAALLLAALPILPGAPVFDLTPGQLPAGYLGRPYTGGPIIAAGGGLCPTNVVALSVSGGTLPPGLELTSAGYLRGAPTEPGVYRFLVRAANACGSADREFSVDISGAPVLLVNPSSVEFRVLAGQRPPEPMLLRVSSDTPALAYSIAPPAADWVEARVRAGVTPGRGAAFDSDIIALHFDFTRLAPGTHKTSLRLSAWRGVQPAEVPIEVTVLPRQAAAAPSAQSLAPVPVSAPVSTHDPAVAAHLSPAAPAPAAAHGPGTVRSSGKAAPAGPASKPAPRTGRMSRSASFRPRRAAPAKTAPKESAAAPKPPAGHGEKPAAGHGEKPAAGHGDKPAAGHGDKPAAGHGEKPAAGHGEKPDPHAKPAASQPKPDAQKDGKHKEDKKSADHQGTAKDAAAPAHKAEAAKHH